MKSERILRSGVLGKRFVPRNLLCRGNDLRRRDRQRWHVQRLTNVTSGFVAAGVMMQERATTGEVKQRQASENGQRSPQSRSS
jgi:hypothetical protein